MFTTVAYYEAQDGGGAYHLIAAVPDQHITIFGDDIRVPKGMTNIIGKGVLSNADAALTDAYLESPTLRKVFNPHIGVLVNAIVFGNPPETLMHPLSPTPLTGDESMNLFINSDETADDSIEYGLVWLSDGPQQPVNGNIYTMQATAAASLVVGTWVNSALTFAENLPAGEYEVVGMRVKGANLVAARLVFQNQTWRPGVPAVNALGDRDLRVFRYGGIGTFGRFDQTSPPTLDCMGVTDTAQLVWLDLIKVA